METIENYFIILVIIQLSHSQEEIWNRFDKYWPIWKMSRRTFVMFELLFSLLLLVVVFWRSFPDRYLFMITFNLLMFANGIWHLMWAGVKRQYVPGLITAPLFVIVFLMFYFQLLVPNA